MKVPKHDGFKTLFCKTIVPVISERVASFPIEDLSVEVMFQRKLKSTTFAPKVQFLTSHGIFVTE